MRVCKWAILRQTLLVDKGSTVAICIRSNDDVLDGNSVDLEHSKKKNTRRIIGTILSLKTKKKKRFSSVNFTNLLVIFELPVLDQ